MFCWPTTRRPATFLFEVEIMLDGALNPGKGYCLEISPIHPHSIVGIKGACTVWPLKSPFHAGRVDGFRRSPAALKGVRRLGRAAGLARLIGRSEDLGLNVLTEWGACGYSALLIPCEGIARRKSDERMAEASDRGIRDGSRGYELHAGGFGSSLARTDCTHHETAKMRRPMRWPPHLFCAGSGERRLNSRSSGHLRSAPVCRRQRRACLPAKLMQDQEKSPLCDV